MGSRQECKVFIGGLSWDTNDSRLRTYFENFGGVKECFVSYCRDTGKPRGFGFVVFEDTAVADRVVLNKHTIDRREVDVKHAVPRQDYTAPRQVVPDGAGGAPAPTRKVFVGGLPSSVADSHLRYYFEQYGTVEDAVVMIDHQSKRPRGFGFVTFHDPFGLENALSVETRQSLHGKEIEVKRAVPRDMLPDAGSRQIRPGRGTQAMPAPCSPFHLAGQALYGYPAYPGGPPVAGSQFAAPGLHPDGDPRAAALRYGPPQPPGVDYDGQRHALHQSNSAGFHLSSGDDLDLSWQTMQMFQMQDGVQAQQLQALHAYPRPQLHDRNSADHFSGSSTDFASGASLVSAPPAPATQPQFPASTAPDVFENLASSLGASLSIGAPPSYLQ